MNNTKSRMTLAELYQSQRHPRGENALALLKQTHWFTVNAEFDPRTGEALPQGLSTYLAKLASHASSGPLRDRLWRITEHARSSVERLFHSLNHSPRREHALLPIHAVRELDANSFIKLSNRPGRTIREKLAGKPYLQAVRRFQSLDLPENRLLKAFVIRLTELLKMRQEYLGDLEDEVTLKIQAWLITDEAVAIARWENLPPNNTLLSHRDYRRIWDAWRWLQSLDDDISRDFSQLEVREQTMRLWSDYGKMYSEGQYLFAEMPVLFDFEKFEIRPWLSSIAFQPATRRVNRLFEASEVFDPSCVDLVSLHPCYATLSSTSKSLRENYLWQRWKDDSTTIDIDLFDSDAAYHRSDVTTISLRDLFFSKDKSLDDFLDSATRAFANRLRNCFKNDSLVWLVPDHLHEFDLRILCSNLNALFLNAEPLPRSVASVIEQVDYTKISRNGFSVVIVDTIGNKIYATKLIARHDKELQQRVPETRGYYWERCPPINIASEDSIGDQGRIYDFITIDKEGNWLDAIQQVKPRFTKQSSLKNDSRIGQFDYCINVVESPVVGGIRLHSLQRRAEDIPLWRYHIPELSIKLMKNGRYRRFHLVSRGEPVRPVRGAPIQIPVHEIFTLPAGRPYYQFPLYQGENADELGFSARLDSPAFPLAEDVVCRLNLTFEYGSDEPYKLAFCPIDNLFPPVRVTWRRTEEAIVTDAPSPEYPTPMTWEDLQQWVDAQGTQVDLLEWLCHSLDRLHELIPWRCTLTINSEWKWKTDANGDVYWFAFASTDEGKCYCNSKNILDSYGEDPNDLYPIGTELFGNVRTTSGRLSAFDISVSEQIAPSREVVQRLKSFKEKSLQNRMSLIWADGRSLSDSDVPVEFKRECNELMSLLSNRLPDNVFNSKMLFLLACLHRDTSDECVQWITGQVESGDVRDPRAVGFALGDVSEQWQVHILSELVANPTKDALRVFAYAIWREQHFVHMFTLSELESILNGLNAMLGQVQSCPRRKHDNDSWTVRNWVRDTAEPLELLLGLLRTRSSASPEIRMLLQPHQKVTKELSKQVERVTEIVAQSNVTLFSRVQINLQKPDGDRTPDLLYALRLYLTGEDGANAIHITSVSDGDSD